MARIVECVPNFSEGKDQKVLSRLEAAVAGVPGVQLLDIQTDAAHNRSVFTMVGSPEAVSEAAFQSIKTARDAIDLTKHKGEHPRMGAADVVPFIPVEEVTMEECVELAKQLAQRVGTELSIPVFLYAKAAARPSRERLPDIRKGEFEGLREAIGLDPEHDPDFGPKKIHPTAGATAIGARPFLVAYNIYLESPNVDFALEIARKIRTSSGGLPAVQAKGFFVDGMAQVSMNLLDIDATPPIKAFEMVQAEAASRGVNIAKSEIVGLIPERALIGAGAEALKLADDPQAHLLEAKVRGSATASAAGPSLDAWIDQLASVHPTPGGGSAAALTATLSAALVTMVARLTVGRKAYAEVDEEFGLIEGRAEELRKDLRAMVDEDAAAFDQVSAAYKLPKATGADKIERTMAIDEALVEAAAVPARVAAAAEELARLAWRAAEAGNKNAASDAASAAAMALAACRAAALNVETNVAGLSNPDSQRQMLEETRDLLGRTEESATHANAAALERIKPAQ
jgi:glutamate formiminotransferase/formiminotetrahydrofolate cyclodeaminase